jgi:hypothetical protein
LNLALRPHALRFAPDVSSGQPRHARRHDGEQLARRTSVIYGKTIDHVVDQHVVCCASMGTPLIFRPLSADRIRYVRRWETASRRRGRTESCRTWPPCATPG